jgi:hypothetical protein
MAIVDRYYEIDAVLIKRLSVRLIDGTPMRLGGAQLQTEVFSAGINSAENTCENPV